MILNVKQVLTYLCRLKDIPLSGTKDVRKYIKAKKVIRKIPRMEGARKRLETFVFFDLETTGLFGPNGKPPRITELGMVAVLRDSFSDNSDKGLSRIKYKLLIPLNPVEEINHIVQNITGFSNKGLKQLQPFSTNTKILLNAFLQQLKGPICLVAHCGNNFDYPIFLSELQKIDKLGLDGTIYTIDSISFFKDFFRSKTQQTKRSSLDNVIESPVGSNVASNTLLNDGYDSVLNDALDSFTQSFSACDQNLQTDIDFPNTIACPSNVNSNPSQTLESYNYSERMRNINEKTPESQMIKSDKVPANFQTGDCVAARRRLDFHITPLANYKLGTIYKHIFDTKPNNSHTAEGDCITLLQCAMRVGNSFVEWADDHAIDFCSDRKS